MINDVFKSFFRTIGRILAYISVGLAIAYLSGFIHAGKVSALENANIGTYIGEGRFYSLSPYPTTQNVGFQTNTSVSGNSDLWSAIPTTTNWTYGQNGGALVQCGMSFVKDFYYSVTYNFLISSSNNYLHTSYTGWSGHQIGVCTNINCVPWTSFDTQSTGQEIVPYLNGDYIGSFTVVFKAPQNGTCVSIAFSSSNRSTNPQHAPFVGYKYASLGSAPLTESQIKNALSADVNDLKNRIDSMKDEQAKTNQKLDDLNKNQAETNKKIDDVKGTITSEDGPKLDALENSAGWLPAGPLDSILNLPLSLLQNLSTNLSKTCQPVTLPLPYVDKTVELPCISTIYSQIDGLNAWLNTIGIIASAFILFFYLVRLEKWVDDTLTLRENSYIDNWGGM